ncbi:hypothetical protein Tco_0460929 [Tanacetum coccineum]
MGGRSTLYCQGEELVLLVNTASLIFEGRLVLPVHVNAAITKGEEDVNMYNWQLIDPWCGMLQRKSELRRFCFIQGDDYISTSGEALAL